MGNGASLEQKAMRAVHSKKTLSEVVAVMMPVYYTEEPVTPKDIALATANWEMILDDSSPAYIDIQNRGSELSTCIMFFYETFYGRLFDVHPVCNLLYIIAVFCILKYEYVYRCVNQCLKQECNLKANF